MNESIRIKDIDTETAAFADDDYLAIDGDSTGTRKIKASQFVSTGPQGEKGDKGDKGDIGPTGANGKDGASVTVKASQTACVNVGDGYIDGNGHLQVLTSIDEYGVKNFTDVGEIRGPQGAKGATGPQGPAGTNASKEYVEDYVDTSKTYISYHGESLTSFNFFAVFGEKDGKRVIKNADQNAVKQEVNGSGVGNVYTPTYINLYGAPSVGVSYAPKLYGAGNNTMDYWYAYHFLIHTTNNIGTINVTPSDLKHMVVYTFGQIYLTAPGNLTFAANSDYSVLYGNNIRRLTTSLTLSITNSMKVVRVSSSYIYVIYY